MRRARASWRALRLLLHLLHGVAVLALGFALLDEAARQQRVRWWSAKLLRLAGLQLRVSGTPRPGATLLLANHVSWLDVAAIHAAAPHARFVAKAELRRWPVVGWMSRAAGTLFIERERKRDALRVVHQLAQALRDGHSVVVFPEGTTGDGATLLPFHANLLQAAVATGTPVQPVVLRYSDAAHRFSPAVQYLGATTLVQSARRVLSAQDLCVHVELLAPQGARHADRRALAALVREQIEHRLRS